MGLKRCWVAARFVLILAIALAGSGCVSPRGYFTDRWRDAKDIFTVSIGTGGPNASVRAEATVAGGRRAAKSEERLGLGMVASRA